MTSTSPKWTLGLIAYWLAVFLYQGNPDRNCKLWNIVSSERYIYFICRCCCRKGRTIRSRISYLYVTAFNVTWTILSWVRTSWQIPAHKLKVFIWRHVVNVQQHFAELICAIFRPGICKNNTIYNIEFKNYKD